MTFCFAWKDRETAYVVADTLVTQENDPAPRHSSSFNEAYRRVAAGAFVEERLIKVRELKPGTAVAIAGEISLAVSIVDFLREQLAFGGDCGSLWAAVEASFGPFDPTRCVELLVVESIGHSVPTIWTWNTFNGCEQHPTCAWIGSLPRQHAERIVTYVLELAQHQGSRDATLLLGVGAVQLLAQHEDFIREGVGGATCGLRVEAEETTWLQDYVSVLYDDDRSIQGGVSVHVREGNLLINSSYHDDAGSIFCNRYRATPESVNQMEDWCARWLPTLHDYLNRHLTTCSRWIFINRSRPLAVLFLVRSDAEHVVDELGISIAGDNVSFDFSDRLDAMLWRAANTYPKLRILDIQG